MGCTADPPAAAEDAPSFVVVITDDQTVELMRALGRTRELIGDPGVTFANSYVNYPTCCPSRATLLTGQHATNHGVIWNSPPTGGFQAFEDQDTTLAAALDGAGYRTAFVGKYLNGYGQNDEDRFAPPGWDDFQALVAPSEVLYFDYTIFDNGELRTYGDEPDDHADLVLAGRATDALASMLESDDPFLLLYAPIAPHAAGGAPVDDPDAAATIASQLSATSLGFLTPPPVIERHHGRFAGEVAPTNPATQETDVDDKPLVNRRRAIDAAMRERIDTLYRAEMESLLIVDETVEAIVEALEESGRIDDTFIIFTSDNGLFHGEHAIPGSKYVPYEPAIRVPLLIRGPGVAAGTVQPSLVSNIDLAPTILDLADVEPLREQDGRSLVPLLQHRDERWGRALFIEGHAPPGPQRSPYVAVHTGSHVLIEYATGESELYDLVADPWQLENRAADPAFGDTRSDLEELLRALEICRGESCREIGTDLAAPAVPIRD